jgi:di/tricarboxylate transporter
VSDATIVYIIIGAVVAAFIANRVPVELVAIGSALALYFTDILTVEETLAGFGSPTVVFIASLFVVAEALEATGVTAWVSHQLAARGAGSPARLMVFTLLLVALLSAFITPNGAVAAFIPVVVILAMQQGNAPSAMLLPLTYASFGGALLTLSGSPVNVIVAEASHDAGAGGFAYFEFAIVGVPLLAGTIIITLLLGARLVPRRTPQSMPADFSEHARTLIVQYALDQPLFRLQVEDGSPFIGTTREQLDLARYPGVTVISAQAEGGSGPVGRAELQAGDFLVLAGDPDVIEQLASERGLRYTPSLSPEDHAALYSRESGVVEVVIPPRSPAVGQSVFPGMLTDDGGLVVLAVQRNGEDRPGKTKLAAGDTLVLEGPWQALSAGLRDRALLAVDSPELIRRQVVPLGARANIALGVLASMVVLLATGAVNPAIVALLAACALVVTRVLTMKEAYRSIAWTVVILIGAMIPLSTAMTKTGAAEDIASIIVDTVGGDSPYLLLIALFVLVAVMGQVLSNTATALIVVPVAVAAALELDVSAQPILMSVTVAATASFLTPIATTPNLMVQEPGGFGFGDYWKFGLPMLAWYFIVAVVLIPLVWRF